MSNTSAASIHHCLVHAGDINERIAYAKTLCQQESLGRFTPLRETVYRLILSADKPLGAYDLVSQLQAAKLADGKCVNIAPPTIYRSLEFLLQAGLIHQLNSINAYVPCCHPRTQHVAAFLLCVRCQTVQELSNPPACDLVAYSTQLLDFQVQKTMIELSGLCHDCR